MAIEYRPGTSRVVDVPGYGPDILQNEQVTPGAWVETDDEGNVLRSGYEVYKEARAAGDVGSGRLLSSDPKYAGLSLEEIAEAYGEYYDVTGFGDDPGYIGPPVSGITPVGTPVDKHGNVTNSAGFVPASGDDLPESFESDDNFKTLKQGFLQTMLDIGLDTATTNELWSWVKGRFIADSTFTSAQAMIEVYDQKAFKDRFPGIALMREDKRYLSAPRDIPTPAEYLLRERTLARQLEQYGMAALGANLDNLVRDTFVNSVGDDEITERLTAASNMIYKAPEEIKQTFMDWYGPASDAALMTAFLDPDDKWGGDWVDVRKTVESATYGGAAAITLDETITKQRAEAITALGRTQESVWKGFANLKLEEDLYKERIGEANLELGTHGTSAEFGMKGDLVEGKLRTGQELADMIAARKARRASDFAGGGGALMSGSATGFGAANA
tara:strand:+ start:1476 stop:2804 length:1329 start_codon:yes stop_codon:yes gene_type:complete